jgi:exodeoxyribonuclease VII small subunit
MKTNPMTYRQAMAELTGIVNQLRDSENVDVDELVTDVARAKELIDFCGGKIKNADVAIKGIISGLQTNGEVTLAAVGARHETLNAEGADNVPF